MTDRKAPGRPKPATQRGYETHLARPRPAASLPEPEYDEEAFTTLDASIPTHVDPSVPTGARDRPAKFDPVARIDDHRKPPAPGRIDARDVIAQVPTPEPLAAARPGKREAARFDPHGRIDDSSRTKKWDPNKGPAPASAAPERSAPGGPRPGSEPVRVTSMKTPMDVERGKPVRELPVVHMRAISDVQRTPARGLGRLAPPFDPEEARTRRFREYVIWGGLAVILACVVTLVIWFLGR